MWAQVCNLLFPRGCAGCDAPDEVLCAACWALFAQCRERDADSGGGARIWSASIYQGAVRRAILDWKDHDDTELDGPFGRIMVSLLNKTPIPSSCLGHRVLVVPVPSSRASMRRRGRAHTAPLAKSVAGALRGYGRRCATMQCPELLHQGTLRAAGLFGTACPSYHRSCQGEA